MPNPRSFVERVRRAPFTISGQTVERDADTPGLLCVIGKRAKTWDHPDRRQDAQRPQDAQGGDRPRRRDAVRRAAVAEHDYKAVPNVAMEKIARLRAGRDRPGRPESGPTLSEAWKLYRTPHLERTNKSPRTIEQYVDTLERTLADWLDTPLRELAENPEQVAQRHTRISERREPDATAGPYQAGARHSARRVIRSYSTLTVSGRPTVVT
jgi:hypothetical protein